MMNNKKNPIMFYDLEWDTDYFGIRCAKAILHEPLSVDEWKDLKQRFKKYQFVSIENRNSEPVNSQLLGKDTCAFLADVNVQFKKKLGGSCEEAENVEIFQALSRDENVIEIADFQYSKFKEDPQLAKRGGDQIYHQWIRNAFEKPYKYFELSRDENKQINGFILFSYADNACVIELIAVAKNVTHCGVGTKLFQTLEHVVSKLGYEEIRVGTQARNIVAVNFYHKVGCKQVGIHQVYHLWNLETDIGL